MQERRTVAPLTAAVAAVVVVVDQLTKTWAERVLADGPIHLFWTVRLNLVYNEGGAFSIARGITPVLAALGVVLLIVLVTMARSATGRIAHVGMGLMIGGAAGNLTDRFFRGNDGAVIDFVDFQWWPVWNVADAALVTGAILLVVGSRSAEAARP